MNNINRSVSGSYNVINFSNSIAFEETLSYFNSSSLHTENTPLILDLTRATYLDIAAILFILSMIYSRFLKQYETRLVLPENELLRDFLSMSNFARALQDITDHPFSTFLAKAERNALFFDETPQSFINHKTDEKFTSNRLDTPLISLELRGFFSIQSWVIHPDRRRKLNYEHFIIRDEMARWSSPIIQAALYRHFKEDAVYISTHISQEAIKNALMYPNAKILLELARYEKKYRRLNIAFYDDGQTIHDNLKDLILQGKSVRQFVIDDLPDEAFTTTFQSKDGRLISKIYDASFTPGTDSPDYEVLLAAFMPGISGGAFKPREDSRPYGRSGIGLCNLLNAAIDILGGSVVYRGGNMMVSINGRKSAHSADQGTFQYLFEIRETNIHYVGNLFVIRLPKGCEAILE